MRVKFDPKVQPTLEQFNEINEILQNKKFKQINIDLDEDKLLFVKDHEYNGKYGIYRYRVNISHWKKVTILSVTDIK